MWNWGDPPTPPASVAYSMKTDPALWPKTAGQRPLRRKTREGCVGAAMERRKVYMLVVLWVTAHLSAPGMGLRAPRRTTLGHKASTGLTGQDANGVPLRRSKRGWMWNQFFLLEEYTGTDLQYVGKVASNTNFHYCSFFRGNFKTRLDAWSASLKLWPLKCSSNPCFVCGGSYRDIW